MPTEKIIINFAPTGMVPTKRDTPFVPVNVKEIVKTVKEAWELGITMVHIHARDENTCKPCYKKETYARIIYGIREFTKDLVICVSTSGRTFPEVSKRMDVLTLEDDLKPDMASLTLGSLNFSKQASINDPDTIVILAKEMKSRGIVPELEAFDVGMINVAKYLMKKGVLSSPSYMNLILGNLSSAQPDILQLGVMLKELSEDCLCALGGIGDAQPFMNSLAISLGMGVRTGLEDNIWHDRERTKLATNGELLKRVHAIIKANEKAVMTPPELRTSMNLKGG